MIAYMTWNNDLSVGVAQFDEEHRQLFVLVNEMHDGVHNVRGSLTNEALGQMADKVIAHLLTHLDREEKCFDELHYPRTGAHKAMHEQLKARINALRSEVGHKESRALAAEMLHFLREALLDHVQDEDKNYGPYLNEQGVH
ncbi:MAG: bacteriohemerythrin [Rhizomicrobium sp.]